VRSFAVLLAIATAWTTSSCFRVLAADDNTSAFPDTVTPLTVPRKGAVAVPATQVAPSQSEVDREVAQWLENLITSDLYRFVARKEDQAGLADFYTKRGYAPIWTRNGRSLRRTHEAIDFLHKLDIEGLNPTDYPTPYFAGADALRLAKDDLILTNSVLMFTRHVRSGRVSFTRLIGPIHFPSHTPNPSDVLGRIVAATDVRKVLDSFNPQQAPYKALKVALALERGTEGSDQRRKSGRRRLDRIDTILANMERWRWLPHDLGTVHVIMNIPDHTLSVIDHGSRIWSTSIVVGARGKSATPLFSATMKYITVNPTSDLTSSLIRNEYTAALAEGPSSPAPAGFAEGDRTGVNGDHSRSKRRTEAGHIRFDFPNKFLVYQRDAPNPQVFLRSRRTHGQSSVFVQDPERYAQVLLSITQPEDKITIETIRNMYDNKERIIQLKNPIPVYVTYQTAFVGEAGQLQIHPDIYGYDKEINELLRDHRRIADIPIEPENHSGKNSAVKSVAHPQHVYSEDWQYGDAPSYVGPAYEDTDANCIRKYRSYDVRTRTYLGYDGIRHPCP
jgi:murein L,D-transpeptidase YcbB/YkuD